MPKGNGVFKGLPSGTRKGYLDSEPYLKIDDQDTKYYATTSAFYNKKKSIHQQSQSDKSIDEEKKQLPALVHLKTPMTNRVQVSSGNLHQISGDLIVGN